MNYLFLGEDSLAKDIEIAEIKKKIFPSPDALKFDFEILYAQGLNSDILKQSFMALPAVSKKRLVVIRECHKLSARNKELVLEFCEKPEASTVLILDSDALSEKDAWVGRLKRFVKIMPYQSKQELNVFDLTRLVGMQKTPEALKIASQLISNGVHPLQIIGGLVWFWGKSKMRLSKDVFRKGLLALEEADLNIKRSRLKPDYALEVLIVKLCSGEL